MYLISIYWAFQTLTTVGYGDISGQTSEERFIALTWIIAGCAFYSYTIGNLQLIMNEIDIRNHMLNVKTTLLDDYTKETGLPMDIAKEVQNYLQNNSYNELSLGEVKKILDELPESLQEELASELYENIIVTIKFFKGREIAFIWEFIPELQPLKAFAKDLLYY